MITKQIKIAPEQTIGIIGGGQLGRMLAQAAQEMGYQIGVLEPIAKGPAAQVSHWDIVAAYDDTSAILELAERSDVITFEFENVKSEALFELEKRQLLPQGRTLLYHTQHRLREKTMIVNAGLKVAPFQFVSDAITLHNGIEALGLPCVLKTCTGGYDGKGQVVIRSADDVEAAEQLAMQTECILEAWVPFQCEVSAIVCRNASGQTEVFPLSENIHQENILHMSIVPARVDAAVRQKAEQAAIALADYVELVGILAVEMFITTDGDVYINELAPRPHNSGHYTMNGCNVSQFQQHIRAVTNTPLLKPLLFAPTVMVNILGDHVDEVLNNEALWQTAHVHLYGKDGRKKGRKMGHINVVAPTIPEALEQINNWKIWNR
ncbi:MAG: 5-(carboxyamino)imidazole ribonucleotide synthase [Bacilli bacterium]